MSTQKEYQHFEASSVPLQNSNLIEASAGTGKTYSIAILVLRLVLEKDLSIRKILMVTFTKAAVAELAERVRLFMRSAYKYAQGNDIADDNIKGLVDKAVALSSLDAVLLQLRNAVLFLDETAVLTIHSFCQQALNEFAFETNQLFGAEMMPDLTLVTEEELNKFWRKHVTTLHTELLRHIWYPAMKDDIKEVLNNHLSGKKYPGYVDGSRYHITSAQQDAWQQELNGLLPQQEALETALYEYITTHANRLRTVCNSNAHAKKGLLNFIDKPKVFIEKIIEKKKSAYIEKLFPDILERIEEIKTAQDSFKENLEAIRQLLFFIAIQEAGKGIAQFKERNNMLGYNDLISNLHKALVQTNNPGLVAVLQSKYEAVFVDEFQDTDRQQFEIFDKAFGTNTILFYIGDPKQSIYAWRKADIFTYFKAREAVTNVYGMNQNFRSSEPMIRAMNKFFLPAAGFDTFHFKDKQDTISYIEVNSPVPNSKGLLLKNNISDIPFSVFEAENKKALHEAAAAQVAMLLRDNSYLIEKKGNHRRVQPSDIGILVRTGMQGRDIKTALAYMGIPAVTIDDARILQTEEARYLLYILDAIATPNRSSINRALLSPFTGFNIEDIIALDDGMVLELFTQYKTRWQNDGIYTALMDFTADFNVRQILLQNTVGSGERVITNLFQLIELIHQAENRKNLSMPELISWLQRGLDGMSAEGDEYQQRMESDEDAVKIVTIHKSKGLEYNIVLAPFLDFSENFWQDFVSFRDPVSGDYIGAEKKRMSKEQLDWQWEQAEQENRRLLYVAITRAVYKCFIYRNQYYRSSTLATFLNALKDADPGLIEFMKEQAAPPASYLSALTTDVKKASTPVHFALKEEHWRKMSYTMLAAKTEHQPLPRAVTTLSAYDNFIFLTLRRGAKTGNFLHFIFENIQFNDDSHWNKWLPEAMRRFVPGQQDVYGPLLREMLQHVLNAPIQMGDVSFMLSAIPWHKRLAELEFDFPVPLFSPEKLQSLSNDVTSVLIRNISSVPGYELEGIMNGKIDLFFEHEGRYYILDWKSNFLGSNVEDYTPAALAKAMNTHNYHLQYLIYTLAVKKYLESRLPSFDYDTQFGGVIYVFVRGARAGFNYGLFTHKPAIERIQALDRILSRP